MKDVKLSEVKKECLRYRDNRCQGCEFLEGYYGATGVSDCFFGDNRPSSWEIKELCRGQITDNGCAFLSWDDWVEKNAKEYYQKYTEDRKGFNLSKSLFYTELREGDIVDVLACAPHGYNNSEHNEDYNVYLVKKVNQFFLSISSITTVRTAV